MDLTSIASAVILFTIGAGWCWQAKRKSPALRPAPRPAAAPPPAPQPEFALLEQTVGQLISEMKQVSERNVEELTARVTELNKLIARADLRLAELRAQENVTATMAVEQPARPESTTTIVAEASPLALNEAARRLLEKNCDETDMARELGISRGEVRLLVALQQQRSHA